jgi:ribosomal protein S18 acetylase RimI-like enzyme
MAAETTGKIMAELDFRLVDHNESETEYKAVQAGLNEYAEQFDIPVRDYVNLFCYDGEKMVGGIVTNTVIDRANIKWLWVDEDYRQKKLGRQLMQKAEKAVANMGCKRIFVDTMSYQAPGFYVKEGYLEIARIKDFYPGFDRIFYQKDLV